MTSTHAPPTTMALARQQVSAILLSDDARRHIIPLLPHGVSLDRVVSTLHQVVADNPELLECTPASLIMAVGRGVKQDLEFGETAHLVPFSVKVSKENEKPERFEKRAKMLRDYRGDIELVVRSGAARAVQANCFYEAEPFKYEQGTNPFIEHHPIVDGVKRGKMLGAYAWARINVHTIKIAVMSVAEIDKIRQEKSKSWKEGPLPDWYAKKTLIHQVTKDIPKNPKLAAVLAEFEREEEEIPDAEFEVVPSAEPAAPTTAAAEQPQATAAAARPSASTDPATEEQIARLLDLIADEHINQETRDRVERRLKVGIKYLLATTWISALELEIKNKLEAEGDELPLKASA